MALIFHDGFEVGDYATKWTTATGTVAASTAQLPYGYGRCVQINASGSLTKRFTAVTKVICGFAFHDANANTADFFSIMGDSGATTHLTLRWASTTSLGLYRGGTLIASGSANEPSATTNLFAYVEISATIADSGGTCDVKVDGSTVISFTGDTKNAGTATTIDAIKLGANSSQTTFFDDVYIADDSGSSANTFLGVVRVYSLAPTGAGASTQWTPSTGSNWAAVDEQTFSATDFVSDTISGHRDTYAMADLPTTVTTVYGLQTVSIAKKSDAGAITYKNTLRSGGTNYASSAFSPTTSDAAYVDLRTVDPATSAAWTTSGVNAIEAGVEIT